MEIENLNLSNQNLTEFPNDLSNSLTHLWINNNQITVIPNNLPNSLKILYLNGNQITEIPNNLPNSLKYLGISENQITEFPNGLPNSSPLGDVANSALAERWSLNMLDLSYNRITEIHYPQGGLLYTLTYLRIDNNQITEIHNLPDSLFYLNIDNNPINYINPKLYKHRLKNKLCELVDTTPDRLKLCYLYKIAYLILKLQRFWRKKLYIQKSKSKFSINREIECKPGVGIYYFKAIDEFNEFNEFKEICKN